MPRFFSWGENIDGKEGVIRQMKEDGHLIGNHGYTHVQMSKETLESACGQIGETNRKIEEITGQKPEYLRPPYGSWNEELECATDMTVVLWSVDPLDWKLQNTNKVVKKIVKSAEPGDIILLHDVFPTSVQAALEVVDTLKKQGYTVGTFTSPALISRLDVVRINDEWIKEQFIVDVANRYVDNWLKYEILYLK